MFSEIAKVIGAEELSITRVHYTVVDGRGGYFQNVKKILEFSESKIVFQGRKGTVCVEGENLRLGKYCAGDAAVFGNIIKVGKTE